MRVVEAFDELRHSRVFFPPQMHGGEHGDNVSTLSPTTVRDEQVEEIPQGNAGI